MGKKSKSRNKKRSTKAKNNINIESNKKLINFSANGIQSPSSVQIHATSKANSQNNSNHVSRTNEDKLKEKNSRKQNDSYSVQNKIDYREARSTITEEALNTSTTKQLKKKKKNKLKYLNKNVSMSIHQGQECVEKEKKQNGQKRSHSQKEYNHNLKEHIIEQGMKSMLHQGITSDTLQGKRKNREWAVDGEKIPRKMSCPPTQPSSSQKKTLEDICTPRSLARLEKLLNLSRTSAHYHPIKRKGKQNEDGENFQNSSSAMQNLPNSEVIDLTDASDSVEEKYARYLFTLSSSSKDVVYFLHCGTYNLRRVFVKETSLKLFLKDSDDRLILEFPFKHIQSIKYNPFISSLFIQFNNRFKYKSQKKEWSELRQDSSFIGFIYIRLFELNPIDWFHFIDILAQKLNKSLILQDKTYMYYKNDLLKIGSNLKTQSHRKGRFNFRSSESRTFNEIDAHMRELAYQKNKYKNEALQRAKNEFKSFIHHPQKTLLKYQGIVLKVEELYRFSPEEYLNDTIIDTLLAYYLEKYSNKHVYLFNTHFYPLLQRDISRCSKIIPRLNPTKASAQVILKDKSIHKDGRNLCISSPKQNHPKSLKFRVEGTIDSLQSMGDKYSKSKSVHKPRNENDSIRIFEKKFLFLPVGEAEHWSLFIVCHPGATPKDTNFSNRCIISCDSLGTVNESVQLQLLQDYLRKRYELEEQDNTNYQAFPIRMLSMPQQRNHYDCGLYLLSFVEFFLKYNVDASTLKRVSNKDTRLSVNRHDSSVSLRKHFIRQLSEIERTTQQQNEPTLIFNPHYVDPY